MCEVMTFKAHVPAQDGLEKQARRLEHIGYNTARIYNMMSESGNKLAHLYSVFGDKTFVLLTC